MQRRIAMVLSGTLLLGTLGCGLEDYEKRMDEQRKRAREFDQNESLLGERLEPPTVDGKSVWPFELFLRMPHGYQPAARAVYTADGLVLFRFPFGADKDPKAKDDDKIIRNVFVAVGPKKDDAERLRKRVLEALTHYYHMEFAITFDLPAKKQAVEPIGLQASGGAIINFDRLDFAGPGDLQCQCQIFTHDNIAVVFQTPKEQMTGFVPSQEACLKSLETGDEARDRKLSYLSIHKPGK